MQTVLAAAVVGFVPFGTATTAMAAETVVLEAVADTTVRTDLDVRRNDNYGCDPYFVIGTGRGGGGIPSGGPDAMRSLLYFDTSGLPTKGLSSARLELTFFGFDNGTSTSVYTVDVHRVINSGPLTPWEEGNGSEILVGGELLEGCAGTDPASGVAWVGAGDGGDDNNQTQPSFDATVEASTQLDQSSNVSGEIISWDITSVVQSWLGGTATNYGIVLRDVTSDGSFRGVRFTAREGQAYGAPYDLTPPQLVLTFVPVLTCEGFEPPLASGPVSVIRKRALPLKAQLLDEDLFPVTDVNLIVPPAVQVLFTPSSGDTPPTDVTDEVLAVGLGDEGNQFVFTNEQKWQHNLKTSNFTAAGSYEISMVTGDAAEYLIDPGCNATFVVE